MQHRLTDIILKSFYLKVSPCRLLTVLCSCLPTLQQFTTLIIRARSRNSFPLASHTIDCSDDVLFHSTSTDAAFIDTIRLKK